MGHEFEHAPVAAHVRGNAPALEEAFDGRVGDSNHNVFADQHVRHAVVMQIRRPDHMTDESGRNDRSRSNGISGQIGPEYAKRE